jgi:hypothetical protein
MEELRIYKAEYFDVDGNLSQLSKIREDWNQKKFHSHYFLTKQQIIDKLKDGYFVYVYGIGEVDMKDAEELAEYK